MGHQTEKLDYTMLKKRLSLMSSKINLKQLFNNPKCPFKVTIPNFSEEGTA